MYAIFLLALLADVARSHLPLPVGSDSTGGLILNAASQLQVGSAGNAVLRRSNGYFPPVASFKGYNFTLSRWAKILTHQSTFVQPTLAMLSVSALGPSAGTGSSFTRPFQSASLSRTIFEHTGSPAP
jgi:hypothetical protein